MSLRDLLEVSVYIGSEIMSYGIITCVVSIVISMINSVFYILLCIMGKAETDIGKFAYKFDSFVWGLVLPSILLSTFGMVCYISKLLIKLKLM